MVLWLWLFFGISMGEHARIYDVSQAEPECLAVAVPAVSCRRACPAIPSNPEHAC